VEPHVPIKTFALATLTTQKLMAGDSCATFTEERRGLPKPRENSGTGKKDRQRCHPWYAKIRV